MRNASECSDYIADTVLNNTQLLGDDFFLSILSSELNISLARSKAIRYVPENEESYQFSWKFSELPHQSGLCKSGLSIRGAISMLQSIAYIKTPSIIINVGSIDIMHGRDLVEMRLDYKELVDLCVKRNIRPIITTLAPLANTSHYHLRDMREKLILFNNHLLDHYYHKHHVINLWSRMTTPRGRTIFEYFELYADRFGSFVRFHFLLFRVSFFQRVDLRHWKQSPARFVEPNGPTENSWAHLQALVILLSILKWKRDDFDSEIRKSRWKCNDDVTHSAIASQMNGSNLYCNYSCLSDNLFKFTNSVFGKQILL